MHFEDRYKRVHHAYLSQQRPQDHLNRVIRLREAHTLTAIAKSVGSPVVSFAYRVVVPNA